VSYRGRTRRSGQALRRYADRQAIERATVDGQLATADQAAERLGIRRSDLNHLIRLGWLEATARIPSNQHRRITLPAIADKTVPLYRTADLDVLLEHPAFDWDEIRATPRGRRSALAQLTTNPCRRDDPKRSHRWPIDGRRRAGDRICDRAATPRGGTE